jgi:hypothetical protein
MKVRRRFLLALMASMLLHLGIVTGPGWLVPSLDDLLRHNQSPPLDAWLVRSADRPVSAPKPRPRSKPKAERSAPSAGPVVAPPMPVAEPEPMPAPERERSTEAPVDDNQQAGAVDGNSTTVEFALYGHLWIRYSVSRGEGGFVIGQAVQEFRSDGGAYYLRSATETTGLVRLFKRVDLIHSSAGQVVNGHLQPREFRIERDGAAGETAIFDWPQGKVWLGERHFDLEPGAQDMLSMFCELALIPIDGPTVSLPVVTGKKVERYQFTVIGEETLATPMGEQPTLHLRTQGAGSERTDIWLGYNFARLPLRIRHVDRKGEVYDQVAGSIEIDPLTERPH